MQVELFMVIGYVLMSSAIGVFAAGSLAQLAMRADGNTEVQPFVRASYVASTALMVGGAACTLLHLGNIGYFYGILTNFGSWLTRESWLVGGFAAMCVAASVLAVRGGARKPLAIVGVLGMIAGVHDGARNSLVERYGRARYQPRRDVCAWFGSGIATGVVFWIG